MGPRPPFLLPRGGGITARTPRGLRVRSGKQTGSHPRGIRDRNKREWRHGAAPAGGPIRVLVRTRGAQGRDTPVGWGSGDASHHFFLAGAAFFALDAFFAGAAFFAIAGR